MKVQMDTKIQKTIRSRRAVAPIIATLLLIAIAVIGGVMIYVFTQGFFGNSSISTSPSVDTITLVGYDMREVIPAGSFAVPTAGITQHEGDLIFFGDAALDSIKTTDEEGTIFIRNVGQKPYTVSKIEVNGLQLDFASTNAGIVAGTYGMFTIPDAATTSAGITLVTAATVLPGEEATILVSFDGGAAPDNNEAAAGRTIPVKITSANGSVYNFNVVIGSKS
jgi:flagellin-like protein